MSAPYGPPMALDPLVAMLLASGGGAPQAHPLMGAPVDPHYGYSGQGDMAPVKALQAGNAPGSGYMDALALALQGNQIDVPTQRYKGDSGGFGVGLISGLEHGFSTSRLADMQHRQKLQDALTQQAHDTNQANSEATKEQRAFELAKALKAAPDGKLDWMKQPTTPADAAAMPWLTAAQANGGLTHEAAMQLKGEAKSAPLTAEQAAALGPWAKRDVGKLTLAESISAHKPNASEQDDTPIDTHMLHGYLNQYAGGQGVPSFSRGPNGVAGRAAFYGTVGRLVEAGIDPATAASMSKSEHLNYNNLTAQKGFLGSYGGALDLNTGMVETLRRLAPDLNSPLLNALALPAAKKVLGDSSVTNFEAGLGPMRNEASRILEGGMTGGGVMSVEGKKDMKAILGNDFTIKQFIGAAGVLQQERKNRETALDSEMKQSQDRMHALSIMGLPGEQPLFGVGGSLNAGSGGAGAGMGVPAAAAATPANESEADVVKRLGLKQVSTPVKAHTRAVR